MTTRSHAGVFDVAVSNYPELPLIIDDCTLGAALSFRPKFIWNFIKNTESCYQIFKIPKSSKGFRLIHAPSASLKLALTRIREVVLHPLCAQMSANVTAYREGKGPRDAAALHIRECPTCAHMDAPHTCAYETEVTDTGYRLIKKNPDCPACQPAPKHDCPRAGTKIKMDLRDFFNSTRAAWIRRYFKECVGYNHYAASLLAALMTVPLPNGRRGVPQGAPTSGDICNLLAHEWLDKPLMAALEGSGWQYSRYADDLYFSHSAAVDHAACKALIDLAAKHVVKAGWNVNWSKVEVQRRGKQHRLLGMTINEKINVQRAQFRRIRSITHRCAQYGFSATAPLVKKDGGGQLRTWLSGQIAWFHAVNPAKAERIRAVYEHALKKEGLC